MELPTCPDISDSTQMTGLAPPTPGMVREESTSRQIMWFLVGQLDERDPTRHIPLHSFPFRVGRRMDMSLSLSGRTVSGFHAEIVEDGEKIFVQDISSTNGTYVNGRRIKGSCILQADDLIQFADHAFRVRCHAAESGSNTVKEDLCDHALSLVQFDNLMADRAVIPHYQPVIDLVSRKIVGYEVLARSEVFGLETPAAMFRAAARLDLHIELSRMFRWEGVRVSTQMERPPHLFVNTHPAEVAAPGLIESMRLLRQISPHQPLTLEIHEGTVTNIEGMKALRAALGEINVRLAFDDFGAGQNRLMEIVEVRPDYLKFDMGLVRNIHLATAERQTVLQALVRMALDLGIVSLAEGIECEHEGEVCRQMGIQLAQGFHYGRPAPLKNIIPIEKRQGPSREGGV